METVLTQVELTEEEREIARSALEHYLSELRPEIVKTERHDWRMRLHGEEDALRRVIGKLG